MNISGLPRNARLYLRAESLSAQLRLRAVCLKVVFLVVALAFALFAFVLLNMGLFAWLTPMWGPVWTPAGLGLINLGVALLFVLAAMGTKLGSDFNAVQAMRAAALDQLEDDLTPRASDIPGWNKARSFVPLVAAVLDALRRRN